MARFNFSEADNYGGSSNGGSFFTLKDDKDTANVRFLYRTIDDINGYAVHKVTVGARQDGSPNERYVNCLRAYNEPLENCPFCSAQMKVQARMFIKLFNIDANECQIWDRSKSYFQKLASLANHYNPLCDEIVEIERNGKTGDKKTEYMFYPIKNEPINLDEIECVDPLGTIILDKTAEEMDAYLDYGSFPETTESVAQQRTETARQPRENYSEPVRRTPQSTTRRAF